ncbi:MAG: hypothetical protein ACK4S4_04850 [Pyrinomonadaceae bacterium]
MFSFLTRPNFPKAAIGLEKEAVTALALERDDRTSHFTVRQAASVELPRDLLVPSFTEKNIANPAELRVLLEEAVATAGMLDQKRWSVSLPSNSARASIITIETEPASRAEAEEILDWKCEQAFGVPAGEMRVNRVRLSPDGERRVRYFATAVKLAVIDEYETVFEDMGWKAGLILPRAVGESNWLMSGGSDSDSLLISSQSDGFTALMLKGSEPIVVRTISCTVDELEDEIYRLLMYYHDRVAGGERELKNVLLVGEEFDRDKVREISNEAFGRPLTVLTAADIGLDIPAGGLMFDEIAGPAGLAALAWN